jgi:hypothetical protein
MSTTKKYAKPTKKAATKAKTTPNGKTAKAKAAPKTKRVSALDAAARSWPRRPSRCAPAR